MHSTWPFATCYACLLPLAPSHAEPLPQWKNHPGPRWNVWIPFQTRGTSRQAPLPAGVMQGHPHSYTLLGHSHPPAGFHGDINSSGWRPPDLSHSAPTMPREGWMDSPWFIAKPIETWSTLLNDEGSGPSCLVVLNPPPKKLKNGTLQFLLTLPACHVPTPLLCYPFLTSLTSPIPIHFINHY